MTDKKLEQLNVKIAKKLGWTSFKKYSLPVPLQKDKRTVGLAPGNFRKQFVPTFTSNLAYAMQLADWASLNGYVFKLAKYSKEQPYQASFYDGKKEEMDWATLPSMAICLAFLKIK